MGLFRKKYDATARGTKSYLYLSDAKVSMLAEGLKPGVADRYDLKVKAGLPGLGVELGRNQSSAGRFACAERLVAALDAEGWIGGILDEDKDLFRGTVLASWGFFNRQDRRYADVVFFTSVIDDHTLLGLGGSAYHTTERPEGRLQRYSNSGIQAMMCFLKERSEAESASTKFHWGPPGAWPAETREADHDSVTVPERIEFVAQRLFDVPDYGRRTILGSPIYVARAGEPVTRQMLREYNGLRRQMTAAAIGVPVLKHIQGRRPMGKPSFPEMAPLEEPE